MEKQRAMRTDKSASPDAHSGNLKVRDSSIELLRIISMLMVMLLHVNFRTFGPPSSGQLDASTLECVIRTVAESFTFICVDVFVLISGWFGIKAKWPRLWELVFQVIFFCLIVDLYLYISGHIVTFSLRDITDLVLLNDGGYWFVRAYILLYVLAPVLNAYVDRAGERNLRRTLVVLFVVQTVQGFLTDNVWYSNGYSPLAFVFLYLLARYMRLYPSRLSSFKIRTDISIYIIASLVNALLTLLYVSYGGKAYSVLSYISPLVILAAVYFFLAFTKFHFTSRAVNYVAVSSLAVYLLHGQAAFLDNVYCAHIQYWVVHCSKLMFAVNTLAMVAGLFVLAIILDKVRIIIWKMGIKFF